MVDRVIEKKRWPLKRILTILGIVALVALAFGSYYFTSGKSRLNVDEERITVSAVTKGTFQETIPVNGSVLPIKKYLPRRPGRRPGGRTFRGRRRHYEERTADHEAV